MIRTRVLAIGSCLTAVALLTGCTPADPTHASDAATPGEPTPAATASGIPAIHVELVEEPLLGGKNSRREAYAGLVDACREAGFAVTPLASEDVARLGTARVRLWFSESVQVLSREAWDFAKDDGPGLSCHFRVVRTGTHSRSGADGVVETDLESHEVTRGAADPASLVREPVSAGDSVMAAMGYQGPVKQSVAGQPCAQWTAPDGATLCLWSGGRDWGFADTVASGGCSPTPLSSYAGAIALSQSPSDRGDGCRLRTVRFTVGTPLDEAAMAAPGAVGGGAR